MNGLDQKVKEMQSAYKNSMTEYKTSRSFGLFPNRAVRDRNTRVSAFKKQLLILRNDISFGSMNKLNIGQF